LPHGFDGGRDIAPRIVSEGRRAFSAPLGIENRETGAISAVDQDRPQQFVLDGVWARQSRPLDRPQFHHRVKPHAPRPRINLAGRTAQEERFEAFGLRGQRLADGVVPHERGGDRGKGFGVVIERVGRDATTAATAPSSIDRDVASGWRSLVDLARALIHRPSWSKDMA
jgi:hypothetical protein